MIIRPKHPKHGKFRKGISTAYLQDESAVLDRLVAAVSLEHDAKQRIQKLARTLVLNVRHMGVKSGALEAFLQEYDLSSDEGIALMCLAEALLRIPDPATADKLIHDKLTTADWETHLGNSPSIFVNASTWGLMLTGKFIKLDSGDIQTAGALINKLVARSSEPAIRLAIKQAMRIMAHQFVMGRNINDALERSQHESNNGYRYSYDMLGEAAITRADADKYIQAYENSIDVIATQTSDNTLIDEKRSISIKLSALHPRFEYSQHDRVLKELTPIVLQLAEKAKQAGIGMTIDAEESDRLELTLDIFETVFCSAKLNGWSGLGLAVQAYQKRAMPVLQWLAELSRRQGRRIPLRLVKGAYWDTEIKRAQELGLESYPVFTRKVATDVSYLACARYMLSIPDVFYPQFATHNAHTVASIIEFADAGCRYEFQRLHGMGEALYASIVDEKGMNIPCRVYAPVGSHEELLPYLVRRLLENGANTSFVNRIEDEKVSVEKVIADPVEQLVSLESKPHPRIPLPVDLYGEARKNSLGVNLNDAEALISLAEKLKSVSGKTWSATPLINGEARDGKAIEISSPGNHNKVVGTVVEALDEHVDLALEVAFSAVLDWDETSADKRAGYLDKAADLIENNLAEIIMLCVLEAGKTVADAISEIREAADFCRYYAMLCRQQFAKPQCMQGPTGERNELSLHGRGVFACISPWNFPVAIFTGQVAAALAAGNTVIAKPAGPTPLCAMFITRLLLQAGIPENVLNLIPGNGSQLGEKLSGDNRIAGIAFTGSTETAWHINRRLAQRDGPIVPLIAETGGQNVMIVDSSALLEQVVADVIRSSFNSAGQRCSALRVLFLQEEIATTAIKLLCGAMEELSVGDPVLLSTDVGPVINNAAKEILVRHADKMSLKGKKHYQVKLDDETNSGVYYPPGLFEIDKISLLEREVFGPILHVVRYQASNLDKVIQSVNNTRYGLTLGIHSRIDETIDYIKRRVRVGNVYVNRNMIGAVVGVQPFGGESLSGTGPKAGGPHYLQRFSSERTLSVNTAAIGGNASLVSLSDQEE